jgi:hypothetical protein
MILTPGALKVASNASYAQYLPARVKVVEGFLFYRVKSERAQPRTKPVPHGALVGLPNPAQPNFSFCHNAMVRTKCALNPSVGFGFIKQIHASIGIVRLTRDGSL